MDRAGVLEHEGQQLPEDLLVEGVDFRVLPSDAVGELAVLPHEGVEAAPDHLAGDLRHPRQVDVGLELGLLVEGQDPLGDVDGHVADPLEVAVDLDGRRDEAQIAGDGLTQGQKADALLLDLRVEPVDLGVSVDDRPGQVRLAVQQGCQDVFDRMLREGPQVEQVLLDALQLHLVVLARALDFFHIPFVPLSRSSRIGP